MRKYLFITGGVSSSLGKGLTAAFVALLLEKRGLRIGLLKLDPYLNVDPGTMSPFQHGEVYVTDDGAETDLDLGHYHRYTASPLGRDSNATAGQIYETVLRRERAGEFLGKTIQIIPHITDEIQRRIERAYASEELDLLIVEIGGTVGDIESLAFLEAIRQFRQKHPKDCLNAHLTYVPYFKAAGETKTKPTQHSVQSLRQIGIVPDFLLCRCETVLADEIKEKIALFCSVSAERVIEVRDVDFALEEVAFQLQRQGLDRQLCDAFGLQTEYANLSDWKDYVDRKQAASDPLRIAMVGKYVQNKDAYKSIADALTHAAVLCGKKIELVPIDAEQITAENREELLSSCRGCIVPGGFGERGWIGKILAAEFCRTHSIPYFGICLGFQVLCVEYARNVLGLKEANSTEMDPKTPHPVVSLLEEQTHQVNTGGTMRLGLFPCTIVAETKLAEAYATADIQERHRHRWELHPQYHEALEKGGLKLSGFHPTRKLCEAAEVPNHPWMVGVQYLPEFLSKPLKPHPLFVAFLKAIV